MDEKVKRKVGRPKGQVDYEGRTVGDYLYTTRKFTPKEQKQYIKEKIEVMKDFGIKLTCEEERGARELTDPLLIDLYFRRLMAKHFGVE